MDAIIAEIDATLTKLRNAKALLLGGEGKRGPGRPAKSGVVSKIVAAIPTKRVMSAEGKAKIAAAQKARWAKAKRAEKRAARATAVTPVEKALRVTPAKPLKTLGKA